MGWDGIPNHRILRFCHHCSAHHFLDPFKNEKRGCESGISKILISKGLSAELHETFGLTSSSWRCFFSVIEDLYS
ncbi:UNVERIFIED_CONTAM: hypothetical protein FO527_18455 [Bacillus sp. ATCC 13368]|nr:hypothetical protein E4J71_12980 [Peribacillus frigoritolerans]